MSTSERLDPEWSCNKINGKFVNRILWNSRGSFRRSILLSIFKGFNIVLTIYVYELSKDSVESRRSLM